MDFGLSLQQKNELIAIFEKFLPEGRVIVYGSRAKGNYTDRSDIDLIIKQQNQNINRDLLEEIKEEIEESDFPYLVDMQLFETIKNNKLLQHIDRIGKIFYEKKRIDE